MSTERLRLAIISEEITDAEVLKLFLDQEVESLGDIEQIVGCLQRHRPTLVEKMDEHIRLAEGYQRAKRALET